jgi:hypothetical protein
MITTYNSGINTPGFNEIYLLNKSSPGIYEIRPFWDFDLATAVEMPVGSVSVGDGFKVNTINGKDNQKFSIECAVCDISASSTNWIPYHTTCSIKNIASGLCMNGVPGIPAFNVTQSDCKNAPVWDIYGRAKPNTTTLIITSTATPDIASTSDIRLPMFGIIGIVLGSIIGTAVIAFVTSYLIIRRQRFAYAKQPDRVNVQVFSG